MQRRSGLVHHCCRLHGAVAIRVIEIQLVDATLAERAAIDRFGCVISHIIIVVTLRVRALGNRCATLERPPFLARRESRVKQYHFGSQRRIPDSAL